MFVDEKAVGEKTPVKIGTLKLSEAIRVGARLRPKCDTYPFSGGKSCAIGAAYEANFGHPGGSRTWQMSSEHDGKMILNRLGDHYGMWFYSLSSKIWNRNDAGESRESIADWLESLGY